MKSLRTGVLALLALGVTGANAGGLGERGSIKDGPYAAPFSWTGFYIGATAGAGSGESRFDAGVLSNPFDINGFTAGATVGYNLQLNGNWVVGIEADLSHSSISGSFFGNLGQPNGDGFGCSSADVGPCATDINWFGTVLGRVGYAINTLLFFGTGGLAYGKVESELRNSDAQISDTNLGWTVGGGVEYAIAPNWSAKLEYLHVDLGWTDKTGPVIEAPFFRSDAKFDVVRVGVNYRFGN